MGSGMGVSHPSSRQAVEEVFPDAMRRECIFHFTKALYRNLARRGLAAAYCEQEEVRRFTRCVMALSVLPHNHVTPAFDAMMQQALDHGSEELQSFMQYVSDNCYVIH